MVEDDKDTQDQPQSFKDLLVEELNRRTEEMHSDIYGSRPYSDGVRFEVERLKLWVAEQK